MRRPPALHPNKVRLGVASDPIGFTFVVASLLASIYFSTFLIVLIAAAGLISLAGLSPWIHPVRLRAERRAFIKHLRTLEHRRQRRETGLLTSLSPTLRERYLELKLRMRDVPQGESLDARAGRSQSLQTRLDELLAAYLRLLVAHAAHERFMGAADEASLTRQLERLEEEIEVVSSRVRAVKVARRDILLRRLRRLEEVCEQCEVISTQLAMVEDIVCLMCESTLMSPDAIFLNEQLDDLLLEVEAVEEAVKGFDMLSENAELAQFEKLIAS